MRQTGQPDRSTHRTRPRRQTPVGRARTHGQAHHHGPRHRHRRRSVNPDHRIRHQVDQPRHLAHHDGRSGSLHPHGLAPSSECHPPCVVVSGGAPMPQPFVAGGRNGGQFLRTRMLVAKSIRARLMKPCPQPHVLGHHVGSHPISLLGLASASLTSSRHVRSPHPDGHHRGHHRHRREGHVPGHQSEQTGGHDARHQRRQAAEHVGVVDVGDGGRLGWQRFGNDGLAPWSKGRPMERSRCHGLVMPPTTHRWAHK